MTGFFNDCEVAVSCRYSSICVGVADGMEYAVEVEEKNGNEMKWRLSDTWLRQVYACFCLIFLSFVTPLPPSYERVRDLDIRIDLNRGTCLAFYHGVLDQQARSQIDRSSSFSWWLGGGQLPFRCFMDDRNRKNKNVEILTRNVCSKESWCVPCWPTGAQK